MSPVTVRRNSIVNPKTKSPGPFEAFAAALQCSVLAASAFELRTMRRQCLRPAPWPYIAPLNGRWHERHGLRKSNVRQQGHFRYQVESDCETEFLHSCHLAGIAIWCHRQSDARS